MTCSAGVEAPFFDTSLAAQPDRARQLNRRQPKGDTMPPTDTPVLDLIASMTADSLEASSLDPESLMLVRIAALAAVDAPAVSYLLNLGAASEIGVEAEQVRGVWPRSHPSSAPRASRPRRARSPRPSRSRSRSPSSTRTRTRSSRAHGSPPFRRGGSHGRSHGAESQLPAKEAPHALVHPGGGHLDLRSRSGRLASPPGRGTASSSTSSSAWSSSRSRCSSRIWSMIAVSPQPDQGERPES